jgi:hypothetical protein
MNPEVDSKPDIDFLDRQEMPAMEPMHRLT